MSCVNPHLAHLDEVGNHDDSCHPLLPDHAPEGGPGASQRSLGRDEGAGSLIAVDIAGVNILGPLAARHRLQLYQALVVFKKRSENKYAKNEIFLICKRKTLPVTGKDDRTIAEINTVNRGNFARQETGLEKIWQAIMT